MSLQQPEPVWWKPLNGQERLWVGTSLVFLVILFFSMPVWHLVAKQNTPATFYRVTTTEYAAKVAAFNAKYKIGEEQGVPVVAPPPGDVFLAGQQWRWSAILTLQAGKTYRIHTSSVDVNHGLSIQPVDMNFQMVPGYDQVITLTPAAGDYLIVCNEFCGVGHHLMVGHLRVKGCC